MSGWTSCIHDKKEGSRWAPYLFGKVTISQTSAAPVPPHAGR